MNKFSVDVTSKALVSECWIPDADVESVRTALKHASVISKFIFLNVYFFISFVGQKIVLVVKWTSTSINENVDCQIARQS